MYKVGWLETEVGAKVDDLSPETKVQESAGAVATGVRFIPGEAAAADGAHRSDG
jgi:hypothetical protein